MKALNLLVLAISLFTAATTSQAAETVHLYLKGETQGDILGDSSKTSLGRANSIEAYAYHQMVAGEPDEKTGITGTVRDHFPIVIVKPFDRSTPKLFRAWRNHETLDCVFKFFRPNPTGDGTTQQFYTVTLRKAYISGISRDVLNVTSPENSPLPPMERVSFTYSAIEEVWTPDGSAAGDEWRSNTNKLPMSDMNFDGVVNMADFAILADEWLMSY